jgi:hypothetical protein
MGLIKKSLGNILLDQNLISEEALSEALGIQKTKGGKLGKILVHLGYLNETELLRAMSLKFGIPFKERIDFQLDKELIQKIPFQFCKQYRSSPDPPPGRCPALMQPARRAGYLHRRCDP